LLGGRATEKGVWHAALGEGLAHSPRAFAAFNTVHKTAIEEAVQMCKLSVQQRRGTEIKAVSLQQIGMIFYALLLSFFCSLPYCFSWHEFLCSFVIVCRDLLVVLGRTGRTVKAFCPRNNLGLFV
jgi:hypothetical protein